MEELEVTLEKERELAKCYKDHVVERVEIHPTRSSKGRIRTTVKPTLRQPGREGFTKGSGL